MADERLVIELLAKEPDIVTPTGLAVDEQGRVWVIENNTHERPQNYKGAPSDRIRILSDFDGGRPGHITTFAEGFKNSMGLALGKNGNVYLATRSEIYLLHDKDGTADERRVLIKLETSCKYPHNGLSGFASDSGGNLYFSLGENLGASYTLTGTDGVTLKGGGEGGSIFSCRPDGTRLARVATGFWNTFHLAFDGFGRLFAVDNDPDSRGPCRLLHVVPGGDYGYRFRYGRKGLHPFVAWNGELPGTLPMVAGTGEAPSGIVAYESVGLPAEYRGDLLATSWGDHLIERFRLTPNGASFQSRTQTLVRGGENFRPVGIVTGPDGALYISDWADKSYPVHGKGRIWRIRMKQPPKDDGMRPSKVAALGTERLKELLADPRQELRLAAAEVLAQKGDAGREILSSVVKGKLEPRARVTALWAAASSSPELVAAALVDSAPEVRGEAARLLGASLPVEPTKRKEDQLVEVAMKDSSAFVRMQATLQLRAPAALKAIVPLLADKDPFLAAAALDVLGRPGNVSLLLPFVVAPDPKLRLGTLLALRRTGDAEGRAALAKFLEDADPEVRRAAIQWVGEEKLTDFAAQVPTAAARTPVTRDLFLALLAAKNLLEGAKPAEEPADEKYLAKVVQDDAQPASFRVLALQMLRPNHPALSAASLREFLAAKDSGLRLQAARALAMRPDKDSQEVLRQLAADGDAETPLRAEAVGGLAHSAASAAESRNLLLSLLDRPDLRRDALRSLREAARQPEGEKALLAWWDKQADAKLDEDRREVAAQLVVALRANKTASVEKRLPALIDLAGARPKTGAEWQMALAAGGDPGAGERAFFHQQGARCYTCHQVNGRGGKIGPDLSQIGRALSRAKLIESILEPSKEIAPQFVSWSIATRDGKVRTGVIVDEGPNSTVTLADAQGKLETIKRQDIEERHALATSLMPDNLHELMTRREFLDVIAFLSALK